MDSTVTRVTDSGPSIPVETPYPSHAFVPTHPSNYIYDIDFILPRTGQIFRADHGSNDFPRATNPRYYFHYVNYDLYFTVLAAITVVLALLCAPVFYRIPKRSLAFWAFIFSTLAPILFAIAINYADLEAFSFAVMWEIIGMALEFVAITMWMAHIHRVTRHARKRGWEKYLHRVAFGMGSGLGTASIVLWTTFFALTFKRAITKTTFEDLRYSFNLLSGISYTFFIAGIFAVAWRLRGSNKSKLLRGERRWIAAILFGLFAYNSLMLTTKFAAISPRCVSSYRCLIIRVSTWYLVMGFWAYNIFCQSRLIVYWMRAIYSADWNEGELELVILERKKNAKEKETKGIRGIGGRTLTFCTEPTVVVTPTRPIAVASGSSTSVETTETIVVKDDPTVLPFKPIVKVPCDLEKVEFSILGVDGGSEDMKRIRAYIGR